jgi:multiple sugar transport system substrate-binding protein
MKSLFATAVCAMLALSVVAWRSQADAGKDTRTVLLWTSDDNPTRKGQYGLFNQEDRQYRVVLDPANAGVEKAIVQSLAGVGPDLIDAYTAFDLGAYVKSGIAMDLTEELKHRGIDVRRDCFKGILGAAVYDGRVYGVPADMSVDAVWYHRDIFAREHVPPPVGHCRWEDLARLAQRLTLRDHQGRIARYGLLFSFSDWRLFFRTYGAHVFTPDGAHAAIDQPEAIAAVEMMRDLIYRYHVSPSPQDEQSMSSQGGWGSGTIAWFGADPPRGAMAIGGRWWLAQMRNYKNQDFGVVESPNGGVRAYFGYGRATLINRNSRHLDGALRFLTYLATPMYNRLVNDDADGICAFRAFAQGKAFDFNPAYPRERDNAVWRTASELAKPDEASPYVDGATVGRLVSRQLDLVSNGAKSPAEAMRSAAREIDAEIAKAIADDPALAARVSGTHN